MFARACLTFALWVALGFGLGMAAIVTLPGVLGYQSLTVVSGSMVPTLGVGSVVIDEVISPADARPGDIVTFKDPLHPRQLTHRLQKVRVEGDTFYMTTLGDANDVPEHWSVPRTGSHRPRGGALPKLGYARAWARLALRPPRRGRPRAAARGAHARRHVAAPEERPVKRWHRFAIAVAVAALVPAAGGATYAAFRATSPNGGDRIEAGSVKLADNDSGGSMLSFSGGYPGHTDTGCIEVTYSGSLDAGVRLYGNTTGTGLDQYLDLKVTRGTYSSEPGFDSCTNFTADATNYIGAGAGVVYNGTLQGYADDYAGGLVDPPPAARRPGPPARSTSTGSRSRCRTTRPPRARTPRRTSRGRRATSDAHAALPGPDARAAGGHRRGDAARLRRGRRHRGLHRHDHEPRQRVHRRGVVRGHEHVHGYSLMDESSNGQPVDATWPVAFDDSILFTTTRLGERVLGEPLRRLRHELPAPVGRPGRVERQLQDEVRLHRRGGLGQRVLLLRGAARLHRRRARDLRQLGQPGGVQHRRHAEREHDRHLGAGHEHDDRRTTCGSACSASRRAPRRGRSSPRP